MTKTRSCDVAIVGYGPVGAALANLLALYGVSVVALDREPSVYHLPRAAHFDGEIMRVFQLLGITDAIRPAIVDGEGMDFLNADGTRLFGFNARSIPGRDGWAQSYMFYQPELETALRSRAAQRPEITVHLEHDVEDVHDGGDHVEVAASDPSGARRTVHAQYVIGCDGARSLTRGVIGADLEDLRCDQPWLVCDVVLRRDIDLPALAIQYCDPARPITFVPMPGNRRRWEFMVMPGEDPGELAGRVPELLAPWMSRDDAEVERATVYTFHALLASPWRKGRVFLAGDAAHQMPPFLGQGMCSGIRDAANLAWKIALVLRGLADDALLDTYETERSPHVRAIIELAVAAGSVIQTTDPEVAKLRDAHFLGGGGLPIAGERGRQEMPPLGPGALAGAPGEVVGSRIPQVALPDGRLLDDAMGTGFALVASDSAVADSTGSHSWWERLGGSVLVTEALDDWFAKHNMVAALVRPDRHVFGFARTPSDMASLVDALSDALGPPNPAFRHAR